MESHQQFQPDDYDSYLTIEETGGVDGQDTRLSALFGGDYQPVTGSTGAEAEVQAEELDQDSGLLPVAPSKFAWRPDYASLAFSILCLAALVIVLGHTDGSLLSSWGYAISPNTVVSILSTAARASLLQPVSHCLGQLKWLYLRKTGSRLQELQVFDDASRGPWGSFKLLWRTRGGVGSISWATYLGCSITVAAIALGPFNQQVLSYPSRPVNITSVNSTVLRSQSFLPSSVTEGDITSRVNPAVQPVLAGGTLGLYDTLPSPPFSCPGAACTFPSFTSLAFCSSCVDVTAQVNATRNCSHSDYAGTSTVQDMLCSYQTPFGFDLSTQALCSPSHDSGWVYTALNVTGNSLLTPITLMNLSVIRFDNSKEFDTYADCPFPPSWLSTLSAYDCKITICAQLFEGWAFNNGSLQKGPVTEFALEQTNLTDTNSLIYNVANESNSPFPGDRTFYINSYIIPQFSNFLMSTLVTSTGANGGYVTGESSDYAADALYNGGGPPIVFGRIVDGMTYAMMQGPNAIIEYGTVLGDQTFVAVQFAWLVPLEMLLVLTGVLLVATVHYTRQAGQRAWKSSMVPALYLPGMGKSEYGRRFVWTEQEREQRARDIREVELRK